MFNPEQRNFQVELRAEKTESNSSPKLTGYAAVFNSPTVIGTSEWQEVIAPGAFAASLLADDIVATFNHDENIVLGRNTSGTLTLAEDEHGLRIEITPPATRADVVELVERKDVRSMSFKFAVYEDGQAWDFDGPMPKRTLQRVKLYDVSLVVRPAYSDTEVSVRSALIEAHRPKPQAPAFDDAAMLELKRRAAFALSLSI